ncbi:MAG: hypothetical protein Q8940_09120 [Bacteroidota bacterium]|nr:hypothetical protein [Bacteroidota bacterium]
MKYKKYILPFIMTIFAIMTFNCASDKPDFGVVSSTNDQSTGKFSDTVYIKQGEDWKGFNRPEAIIVGTDNDKFIYVADTYNDRIVMLNTAGQIQGIRSIKHPIALAEDHQFNLIVCAQMDTVIQGTQTSVSAVYKLNLYASGQHIENAPISRILPANNDFRFLDEVKRRQYTGVCVFYDNSFYVSRMGTENISLIDPDNSILIFQKTISGGAKRDTLIGRVPLISADGTGQLSANKISSMTSFPRRNMDFIVTLVGENYFRTQWLKYVSTSVYTGYESKFQTPNVAIMSIGRFSQPEGAAVDNSGNIFVADAAKDSIFKFNSYGEELQSFGGEKVFNHPHAVAVYNKIVYVADTDNNCIKRFILSTDSE